MVWRKVIFIVTQKYTGDLEELGFEQEQTVDDEVTWSIEFVKL
ncbi:hypothetical protein [Flavobacterium jumunjinense]|nr:hypothetical protein [Flavobacterium jumunjinense]